MKRLSFILLFPAMILAGCKKEPVPLPGTVTVAPDNVSMACEAQYPAPQSLTVTCMNGGGDPDPAAVWTLSSDQAWLKLTLASDGGGAAAAVNGTGTQTVYLVAEGYDGATSRTAGISLGGAVAVNVTQAAMPAGSTAVFPATAAITYEAHAPAPQTLAVTCKKYNNDPDPSAVWTLTSDQTWLKLSLASDGSGANTTIQGTGAHTVYMVADRNRGASSRTAGITLNGGAAAAVSVTQGNLVLPVPDGSAVFGLAGCGTLPTGTNSYVGAFWRARETGERVIRINVGTDAANLGAWSAAVAWYDSKWNPATGDGVVLAAGDSSDPDIRHAINTPGDAEAYTVPGSETSVGGTVASGGYIVFRIGLTREFTAYSETNNPARYAVVVLTYGGTSPKKQKIFLRQGEGPDYVMRPGDKNSTGANVGGTENRQYAWKFSPYNLADPNNNKDTNFNYMTPLAVNGGKFVEYPTQAGYYFQWNYSRRAFSPIVSSEIAAFANWIWGYPRERWIADDETCPVGYRRPHDGNPATSNGGIVVGSEFRQSLWSDPVDSYITGSIINAAWGYYADGWFDRRPITAVPGSTNVDKAVVSYNSLNVASLGRLVFNPSSTSNSYNASLFFPAAGFLETEMGVRGYSIGMKANYWSATSFSNTLGRAFWFDKTAFKVETQWKCSGASVRCVLENQ